MSLRLLRLAQHLRESSSQASLTATTRSKSAHPNPTRLYAASSAARRPIMSDEAEKAKLAAAQKQEAEADAGAVTLFDKIARKEIPAKIMYEDDTCLAFHDVAPQAPVHFLVIPKNRQGLSCLHKATPAHKELLGHLMYVAQDVAKQQGLTPNGFRLVVNSGPDACQSVYHLHIHVLGGRPLGWPPG